MVKINQLFTILMRNNAFMLFFFLIIGASIAAIYQYEILSDFNNYHYYVPWAFFHNRTFEDIAVALENTYFNPLIDMPGYFIAKYFNDYPIVLNIYNGLCWGVLVFVFYKLCRFYFDVDTIRGKILIAITMCLTMTGFALLTQNGTSSNEVQVNICVMLGLYFIFRELFVLKTERWQVFFISGIILGAGLGLKLTLITFCLALGLTLIFYYKYLQNPVKTISLFALGGFLGFCLTFGWWAVVLYQHTGSPIYPYMNNIFHSPYYPDTFLTYGEFREKTFLDYLIFPFLSSFQGDSDLSSESFMIDARFAFGYVLLICVTGYYLFSRQLVSQIKKHPQTTFLVVFSFITYVIWLWLFALIRYTISIEMIISLMIVLFMGQFKPKNTVNLGIYGSCCIVLIFILFSGLPYESWGNRKLLNKIIDSKTVTLPQKTLVFGLSANIGLQVTQLVENNPDVLIANGVSNFTVEGSKLYDKVEQYKKESENIVYLVALKTPVTEFDYRTPPDVLKQDKREDNFKNLQYIIVNEIGIKNFYCQSLSSEYILNKVFLCINKKDKSKIFPQTKTPLKSFNEVRQRMQNLQFKFGDPK